MNGFFKDIPIKFCGAFTLRFVFNPSKYRPKFYKERGDSKVSVINDFAPVFLFVGLPALKQRKEAYKHNNLFKIRIISTIVNILDRYIKNGERPSKIYIKFRSEWSVHIFTRLELFKRNSENQMMFFKGSIHHITYME